MIVRKSDWKKEFIHFHENFPLENDFTGQTYLLAKNLLRHTSL